MEFLDSHNPPHPLTVLGCRHFHQNKSPLLRLLWRKSWADNPAVCCRRWAPWRRRAPSVLGTALRACRGGREPWHRWRWWRSPFYCPERNFPADSPFLFEEGGKSGIYTVIGGHTEPFISEMFKVENKHDGASWKIGFLIKRVYISGAFTWERLNYSKANMQKRTVYQGRISLQVGAGGSISVCQWSHFPVLRVETCGHTQTRSAVIRCSSNKSHHHGWERTLTSLKVFDIKPVHRQ